MIDHVLKYSLTVMFDHVVVMTIVQYSKRRSDCRIRPSVGISVYCDIKGAEVVIIRI